MSLDVTSIDGKFKRKGTREQGKQRGYDAMQKSYSKRAMGWFKDEPYQLWYQKMRGKQNEQRVKAKEKNNGTRRV